ncbi:YbaB/EbfC family nucleoid-associated protein [Gandjariella thermophila]|nr:YbaB/EbfC family nucleoid-associated protein [Gandjariella thermophila]
MERQIDQWAAQVHDKARRYQELKEDLAAISSTATAANGAIKVTVGASGLLTNLELTEDVRTMRAHYLAAQIMDAIRKAQSTLGAQVTELMQQRVGEDTQSIAVVAANYARQFPQPDEQDEGRVADNDGILDSLRGSATRRSP